MFGLVPNHLQLPIFQHQPMVLKFIGLFGAENDLADESRERGLHGRMCEKSCSCESWSTRMRQPNPFGGWPFVMPSSKYFPMRIGGDSRLGLELISGHGKSSCSLPGLYSIGLTLPKTSLVEITDWCDTHRLPSVAPNPNAKIAPFIEGAVSL